MKNINHLEPRQGVKLIVVKLPHMEEYGAEIRGRTGRNSLLSFYGNADAMELPSGNWQIVGLAGDIPLDEYQSICPDQRGYTLDAFFESNGVEVDDLILKQIY